MSDWSKYGSSSSGGGSDWSKYGSVGGGWVNVGGSSGGGGGLLGGIGSFLSRIPGEHLASTAYHGAMNTGENLMSGLYNAGKLDVQDVRSNPGSLIAGPLQPLLSEVEARTHGKDTRLVSQVVKPQALAYKAKYGPVFEHPLSAKSYEAVGHNIAKDPFGTFLDALTVATVPFTAGDSAVLRGASMSMDAGRLGKLDEIARLAPTERAAALQGAGENGLLARRYVAARAHQLPETRTASLIEGEAPHNYTIRPARTPWGRYLQDKTLGLRESPQFVNNRVVGVGSKIAREKNVRLARASQAYLLAEKKAQPLMAALNPDEKIAAIMAREGVSVPDQLKMFHGQYAEHPTPHLQAVISHLESHPGIQEALDNPSAKLVKADTALHELSQRATDILQERGDVSAESAAARRILPQRLASGARFDPATGEFVGGTPEDQLLGQTQNPLNPNLQPVSRVSHAPPLSTEGGAGIHTGMSVEKGGSVATPLAVTKRSRGINYLRGDRSFDPQHVLNDFLQTSRYEHKLQVHRYLYDEIARPVSEDLAGGKHKDEFYIRDKRSAKVPGKVRNQEPLMKEFGNPGDKPRVAARKYVDQLSNEARSEVFKADEVPPDLHAAGIDFKTPSFEDIEKMRAAGIKRLPPSFGKNYRDTFGGGKSFRHLDQALASWRILQLAKPAYGVHNVAQQAGLFGLRFGWRGFRNMARLVRDPELRQALEERTPGLKISGQYGALGKGVHSGVYADEDIARVARAAKMSTGVVRKGLGAYWKFIHEINVRYAENLPREAGVLSSLEHLRRAGESMTEFVKRTDPQDIEAATDEALRFLGDFSNMTTFERHVMSRAFPLLYPWFRTITAVSANLIKDYPGRILLLKALSDAAPKEKQPSWLKGAIVLGRHGGIETDIEQGPLNPFGTFSQVSDEPLSSQINPFAQAGLIGLGGVDPFTGQTYKGMGATQGSSLSADLSRAIGSFAGGLPEVTTGQKVLGGVHVPGTRYAPIHHAKPSASYTQQQHDALLAWLGLPLKHVRRSKAKQYADEGL